MTENEQLQDKYKLKFFDAGEKKCLEFEATEAYFEGDFIKFLDLSGVWHIKPSKNLV